MALPGPAPRAVKIGSTPSADWIDVEDVPYAGERPELPATRTYLTSEGIPIQLDILERTHEWWETLSAMPHCVLWTPTDWQFALDLAYLKDNFFYSPGANVGLVTEMRNRENQLGTTIEARRKLRIRYIESAALAEPTTSLPDFDGMKVGELRALARARHLEVPARARKDQLLDMLRGPAPVTDITDARRRRLIDEDAP